MTKMINLELPDLPPPPGPVLPPPPHPMAVVLNDAIREQFWNSQYHSARSLQSALGPSELGNPCDRALAYATHGTRPVNFPDPMPTLWGSALHLYLAGWFRQQDAGTGRYLVENRVVYKGIPGTCDLFDRRRNTLLDWKSTTKDSRKLRAFGAPTSEHLTQLSIYACGLEGAGEDVQRMGLVLVPRDGALDDLRVWLTDFTDEHRKLADNAIERLGQLAQLDPVQARPTPNILCPWCPYYRPRSQDLSTGCPATKE